MPTRTPAQNLKRIWEDKAHELKFTQRQAAEKLDWSQGAISQYISGITELSVPAIVKMANFLGVSPQDIDPDINLNELPKKGAWTVLGTTSGKPVTVKTKIFNITHKPKSAPEESSTYASCFIVDQPILFSDTTAPVEQTGGILPPGITILTVPLSASKILDLNADKHYPPLDPPVWFVKYKSNKRPPYVIRQPLIPTAQNADVYRVKGFYFT